MSNYCSTKWFCSDITAALSVSAVLLLQYWAVAAVLGVARVLSVTAVLSTCSSYKGEQSLGGDAVTAAASSTEVSVWAEFRTDSLRWAVKGDRHLSEGEGGQLANTQKWRWKPMLLSVWQHGVCSHRFSWTCPLKLIWVRCFRPRSRRNAAHSEVRGGGDFLAAFVATAVVLEHRRCLLWVGSAVQASGCRFVSLALVFRVKKDEWLPRLPSVQVLLFWNVICILPLSS